MKILFLRILKCSMFSKKVKFLFVGGCSVSASTVLNIQEIKPFFDGV